jgi:transcription elongation factor GreA
MTRAGYDKLKADLDRMQNVEMPVLEERVGKARAEGDLSENAEYHGARESLQLFRARVNVLRDKIARAAIVDTSRISKDEVSFGATVVLKDLDCDEDEEFTLVGAGEEDYIAGKILVTSPLAQGLMGKKIGDHAEIKVPKGTIRYKILEIRYEEQ